MHPWQELKTLIPQLQCYLWIVSLLMQGHLEQSHQVQQVTHPRVVLVNLLHLDAACELPGTNSHGGTRTLVCKQIPSCQASGMQGLAFMSYQACTMLSEEVQCKYTLLIPSHVCQAPLILAFRGIPSM